MNPKRKFVSTWRQFFLSALLISLCGSHIWAQETETPAPKLDVPYVPTPPEVVQEMLRLADIKSDDVVYDLGCGDGRIVIAAAKQFGARGVGIDINPERIKESKENARLAGVADRVTFRTQDLFEADFREASVVMLYLLSSVNMKLRPKLWSELKPGTRVVSHAFDMGDWKPDKIVKVPSGDMERTVYFWTIPAKGMEPVNGKAKTVE